MTMIIAVAKRPYEMCCPKCDLSVFFSIVQVHCLAIARTNEPHVHHSNCATLDNSNPVWLTVTLRSCYSGGKDAKECKNHAFFGGCEKQYLRTYNHCANWA
jgi:hypothetical protein